MFVTAINVTTAENILAYEILNRQIYQDFLSIWQICIHVPICFHFFLFFLFSTANKHLLPSTWEILKIVARKVSKTYQISVSCGPSINHHCIEKYFAKNQNELPFLGQNILCTVIFDSTWCKKWTCHVPFCHFRFISLCYKSILLSWFTHRGFKTQVQVELAAVFIEGIITKQNQQKNSHPGLLVLSRETPTDHAGSDSESVPLKNMETQRLTAGRTALLYTNEKGHKG